LTNHFNKLQEGFKGDDGFMLLCHSVMPSTDSLEVLRNYANRYNVDDSKWHLVTGPESDIKKLASFSFFSDDQFKK
jgi:protein SCO1/2